MRRRERQHKMRRELAWYLTGFVLVHAALAVSIERSWMAVRDVDYDDLEAHVRERQQAAPHRPLVLALGSSRTHMTLRPERLWRPDEPTAPMVVNCGVRGAGPMMQQIVLRRLLAAGIRPQLVSFEVMPMLLSVRDGLPTEERDVYAVRRYCAAEVAQLWPYYGRRNQLGYPWLRARVWPALYHATDLRDWFGIDVTPDHCPAQQFGRDAFGWHGCRIAFSVQEVERLTKQALAKYQSALVQPAVAPGSVQAIRDVVQLCTAQRIPIVLLVPPEAAAFRAYAPAVAEAQMAVVRNLADALHVTLIDARTWVDDDAFFDGHHVTIRGADQFTDRFAREALFYFQF